MKNIMTIQYGQKEKKEERRKRREKESDRKGQRVYERALSTKNTTSVFLKNG